MNNSCFFCNAKEELKNIWIPTDDSFSLVSCCKDCFFMNKLERDSIVNMNTWNDYDSNWKPRIEA